MNYNNSVTFLAFVSFITGPSLHSFFVSIVELVKNILRSSDEKYS